MNKIVTDCGCGHAQAVITVLPKLRFRCHCTRCQSIYKAPFADALAFRRGQARLIDPTTVFWKRAMRPSPLNRGLCRSCGRPVLAHLYGAVSIVPTLTLSGVELPPVSYEVYYNTRFAKLDDSVPKHGNVLSSYIACTPSFVGVLLSPGRNIPAE